MERKRGTKTMEEAINSFLNDTKVKLLKGKVKESTFSRYSFICEKHIAPYFADTTLDKLNDKAINNFIEDKLSSKGLSPKTVHDMTCVLLQVIKKHFKYNLDITKPSYSQSEISIFTDIEYNRLKTYLSVGIDSKKLGIIITMLTGLRIGELCALKWKDINLDTGIITINKTMQRIKTTNSKDKSKTKIIIDAPKSKASIRTIPIPEILLHKLKSFQSNDNTYLLTNTADYIEPRMYQRHFKSYLEACSIKDNNFHTIRHTFATMAIAKGVDIKTVSILLGHTDVSFTMKRYVHPNMEHKREQIEKLASGF